MYRLILLSVVVLCGCGDEGRQSLQNAQLISTQQQTNRELAGINESLKGIKFNLETIATRRLFPLGAEKGNKSFVGPDQIKAAIGHGLMAAADICGKDKVVLFFQDMSSDIKKELIPVDLGGLADKKARELSSKRINSLLSQ